MNGFVLVTETKMHRLSVVISLLLFLSVEASRCKYAKVSFERKPSGSK